MSELQKARVSVITPVYNGLPYIAETVDSVLAQAREPDGIAGLEYLVVDDGSTDGTGDFLAQRYGNGIRLIRQRNAGEAAAVNRGVAEATAEIVGIVNADDPIRPGLLRTAVELLERDATLVAVYPDWEMIDGEGDVIQTMETRDFDLRVHLEQHLCLPGPGALFRRAAFDGEPARDTRFARTSDYEMWLRLALKGRIARIPKVLATWRLHDAGGSQSGRNPEMAENKVAMVRAFFERRDLPASVRAWKRQAVASALYCAGLLAIHNPEIPGRRYLLRSIAMSPVWPRHFAANRRRSWVRILYVMLQPFSRWFYRSAVTTGLARERL